MEASGGNMPDIVVGQYRFMLMLAFRKLDLFWQRWINSLSCSLAVVAHLRNGDAGLLDLAGG